jgi:hypothetical protein
VGLLRGAGGAVLGGKLGVVLDLATKLPAHLWLDGDATANDKRFLARLEPALPPAALLVMDRGFDAFDPFDRLTAAGHGFVARARSLTALSVERALAQTPALRDRVVRLGRYRSPPAAAPSAWSRSGGTGPGAPT